MMLRRALPILVALAALALPASAAAVTSELELTTTGSVPAPVPEQSNFNYTLTVTNHGPDNAANVVLEFTAPPSNAAFVSATPSQGAASIDGTGKLSMNFGTVTTSTPATLAVTYTGVGRGTFQVTPTVTMGAGQSDPNTSNNTKTDTITITGLRAMQPTFADQPLGTMGPGQAVPVTNASGLTVTLGALPITGAAPFDFFTLPGCAGATLAPGGSCTFALRFAPGDLGARSASVNIAPTAGPVDPLALDVSGNGVPLPVNTGPAGPQGAPGTQGIPGPKGSPAFRLTLASALKRMTARHGRSVSLGYASTLSARVVLDVLKRGKRVARVTSRARQGANRIRWNGKVRRRGATAGSYVLRLKATNGEQTTTIRVPLRLR